MREITPNPLTLYRRQAEGQEIFGFMSLPDQMKENRPLMAEGPVFIQENTLPHPQIRKAVSDRDGKRGRGQGRSNMGRHAVRPLGSGREEPVSRRAQPVEEPLQVAKDLRVGVLLNEKRGGGMLNIKGEETGLNAGLFHRRFYLIGNFIKAPAGCLKRNLPYFLPHFKIPKNARVLAPGFFLGQGGRRRD